MKVLMMGLMALSLCFSSYANEKGNGGSGVKRKGRYMTFHSAGLYTERTESLAESIPEMENLIEFFHNSEFLSSKIKGDYLLALTPSRKRKYFKVQEDFFTKEIESKILREYEKAVGVDRSELSLFAVTDPSQKITFLLPAFYELNKYEQKAILFHEAYWVLNPEAEYKDVIEAEISFQAYLEDSNSSARLKNLLYSIGSSFDFVKAASVFDIKNNTLSGFMRNGMLHLPTLLGGEWMECIKADLGEQCPIIFSKQLYRLKKKYPNSLLLEVMYERSLADSESYEPCLTLSIYKYSRNIIQYGDSDSLKRINSRYIFIDFTKVFQYGENSYFKVLKRGDTLGTLNFYR